MLDPNSFDHAAQAEEYRNAAILMRNRFRAHGAEIAEFLTDGDLLGVVDDETYNVVGESLDQMLYAMQRLAATVRDESPPLPPFSATRRLLIEKGEPSA